VIALSAGIVGVVAARRRAAGHEAPHPTASAVQWEQATTRGLTSVPGHVWVWGCALFAGLASAGVGRLLLQQRPTLIDEFVQLRHARILRSGALTESWPLDAAFRNSANGFWNADGWTSIYPPGHTAILAAAEKIGLLSWVGPVLVAATVGLTAALVLRLLDDRPTTARVAAAAVALSPFVWGIGAGYLSHTSAACAVALALWAAVRAVDEQWTWAILTGVAAGWAVTSRPLTGVALACLLPAGYWAVRAWARQTSAGPRLVGSDDYGPEATFDGRALATRIGAAVAGGMPFLLGLAWWNYETTGAPLRFGYFAAFGPAHQLGLHTDPWGNEYGLTQAVGYAGSDLTALGQHLFETPIPAVAAIGLWLLVRGKPIPGSGLLVSWALAAVIANGLYWHHGLHMGPRMLYESGPAWLALTVLAAVGLGLPRGTLAPPKEDEHSEAPGAISETLVAFARVATVLCLGWALAAGVPERLGSWVLPPPSPLPALDQERALVFVHGSWASREAARLEASGMRRDSVDTALRRNDLCRVHEYAAARRAGLPLPPLDLTTEPGSPPSLATVELSPGNRARIDPTSRLTPDCAREGRSDANGTIELAPVLAIAPAYGPEVEVVWVRDLGPAENEAALLAFPDRTPWVWIGDSNELTAYGEGMAQLWGTLRTDGR
jgi:hypothetical protein